MPKLPTPSGRDVISFLVRQGFTLSTRHGSHVNLIKENRLVTVPLYPCLGQDVMTSIIRQSGMAREEFVKTWYQR